MAPAGCLPQSLSQMRVSIRLIQIIKIRVSIRVIQITCDHRLAPPR